MNLLCIRINTNIHSSSPQQRIKSPPAAAALTADKGVARCQVEVPRKHILGGKVPLGCDDDRDGGEEGQILTVMLLHSSL